MRSAAARNGRQILRGAVIARHQRHAGALHQRLGRRLVAHRADRGRRRPDEHDAGARAGLGEVGVFGEKAVAGMDRLARPRAARPRGSRRCADSFRAPAPAPIAIRLVGHRAHGARRRRHRNRRQRSQMPSRRAVRDDPAGDLAAIGDQQLRGTSRSHPEHAEPRRLRSARSARPTAPSASTRRVSAGSMMPSSHSRAVA